MIRYRKVWLFLVVPFLFSVFSSFYSLQPSKEPKIERADSLFALGRFLFYEKRMSSNDQISCASCHMQKYAFSDSARFSRGVGGFTKRNSMSLVNLSERPFLFWDARSATLAHQAMIPLRNYIEMNMEPDKLIQKLSTIPLYKKWFKRIYKDDSISIARIVEAITAFEIQIVSNSSKYDLYLKGDTNSLNTKEKEGLKLFTTVPVPKLGIRGAGCHQCHMGSNLNHAQFFNNGLDSVFSDIGVGGSWNADYNHGLFVVPTLRNIALTAPYMHDGRFKSLKEVLLHYNTAVKKSSTVAPFLYGTSNAMHSSQLSLTTNELSALEAFLLTLTDSKLIREKRLSNPF